MPLTEIEDVEYVYIVAAVATIAATEAVRDGAYRHAKKLADEYLESLGGNTQD